MFNIQWDKKSNIPVLTNSVSSDNSLSKPRPVFHEELDLFGLDKHWSYDKTNDPLLWAIGRSYYYRGVEVARIDGGNLEEDARVEVFHKGNLKPVDTYQLYKKNRSKLTILENEAKHYISKEYLKHREDSRIVLAFSGGKDSLVILDLVSQVIPSDEFMAIYTDTGMELPDTRQFVLQVFEEYKSKLSSFQFSVAEQINDIAYNWRQFGPPSRRQRWCCSVTKSIPYYVELAKFSNHGPTIVFEGVRRNESSRRSGYDREASSVKHEMVTNVRPILNWNDTEVYLYLLSKQIRLNPAYRNGLTRVGCSFCPYSSEWSEMLIRKLYPNANKVFIDEIKRGFEFNGISDKTKQDSYINKGKWKVRAGSRILPDIHSSISFTYAKGRKIAILTNPKSSILEWIKVFDHIVSRNSDSLFKAEVRVKNEIARYDLHIENHKIEVHYYATNPLSIDRLFTKILMKTAYCVNCHACFVECRVGAIAFQPTIKIDAGKCIHCLRCITSIDKGCLVASSRSVILGERDMTTVKTSIDRYSTFGLREHWLQSFIANPTDVYSVLGSKQVEALKRWLTDAELLQGNGEVSDLYETIKSMDMKEVWGIVWINLSYMSGIINWYQHVAHDKWDTKVLFNELIQVMPGYSEGTLANPYKAMINMFKNSDVLNGEYQRGILETKGNRTISIEKKENTRIPNSVLVYCLYKHAMTYNTYFTTLSNLYDDKIFHTPYKIFGVAKDAMIKQLTSLQEHRSRVLRVEFNANLDNIFLNKDHTALSALRAFLEVKP